ncbi:MAG: aminopeptidase [Bacteroidales bacterium]|nr:aminopeptidase [Bacteroidales bacterium]
MKLRNKIILGVLLLLLILAAINFSLLKYAAQQGLGQLRMVREAVPIDNLLADPQYPDSLKTKLLLIKEIRRYAIDSLGLHDSPNYNAVYDLKGKPTAYVLQAAEKYRVKKYLWKFPVVGALPYKGYFSEDDAKAEQADMVAKGYDTRIVNPAGWSTMGWFKDPVLSSMLMRDEAFLAELIIHELTHSTIFIKDDSDLNENIADYVGENGAKCYLASKYGPQSQELQKYGNIISDNERLADYYLLGAHQLDSVYVSDPFLKLSESEKDEAKKAFIQQIVDNVDTLSLKVVDPARLKDGRLRNINNTFFTGYMTYYNKKYQLRKECAENHGGDFMRFLADLKSKYGK